MTRYAMSFQLSGVAVVEADDLNEARAIVTRACECLPGAWPSGQVDAITLDEAQDLGDD